MIHLKAGNYHTLEEVAMKFHTNRMKISRIAKKLNLGVHFGRLSVRLHDDDVEKIASIWGIALDQHICYNSNKKG